MGEVDLTDRLCSAVSPKSPWMPRDDSRFRPAPRAHHDAPNGDLVVTLNPDDYLLIYPFPDWEEIERKLVRLPSA